MPSYGSCFDWIVTSWRCNSGRKVTLGLCLHVIQPSGKHMCIFSPSTAPCKRHLINRERVGSSQREAEIYGELSQQICSDNKLIAAAMFGGALDHLQPHPGSRFPPCSLNCCCLFSQLALSLSLPLSRTHSLTLSHSLTHSLSLSLSIFLSLVFNQDGRMVKNTPAAWRHSSEICRIEREAGRCWWNWPKTQFAWAICTDSNIYWASHGHWRGERLGYAHQTNGECHTCVGVQLCTCNCTYCVQECWLTRWRLYVSNSDSELHGSEVWLIQMTEIVGLWMLFSLCYYQVQPHELYFECQILPLTVEIGSVWFLFFIFFRFVDLSQISSFPSA